MAPRPQPQPALGRALRELREEAGISQEELAHRTDIHPTSVSHLESGRHNPSWETVRRLCAGLGVSLSTLVGRVEKHEAGDS
jgi:transcriptional regulator with XRE-family HTH domain